jgi:hypothetical protein
MGLSAIYTVVVGMMTPEERDRAVDRLLNKVEHYLAQVKERMPRVRAEAPHRTAEELANG